MPVLMLMVWDWLVWLAWHSSVTALRRTSVSGGNAPPSKFSASWILVSLVSRVTAAQRGFVVDPIVKVFLILFLELKTEPIYLCERGGWLEWKSATLRFI